MRRVNSSSCSRSDVSGGGPAGCGERLLSPPQADVRQATKATKTPSALLIPSFTGARRMEVRTPVLLACAMITADPGSHAPHAHYERDGRTRRTSRAAVYRAALGDRVNVALAGLNVAATVLLTAPILVPRLVQGRRRLRNMQLAVSLWALAFAFFLVSPLNTTLAYLVLFTGTFLIGVGEAIYASTADALTAALAPAHLRGRYAALHQMAWGVSETITPVLVGVALATGGYTLWLILAALAIAAAGAYRALERAAGTRDGVAGAEVKSVEAAA